jgi:hypothetical protein
MYKRCLNEGVHGLAELGLSHVPHILQDGANVVCVLNVLGGHIYTERLGLVQIQQI